MCSCIAGWQRRKATSCVCIQVSVQTVDLASYTDLAFLHFPSNKPEIAQLLLNAGANVNSHNGRGATTLSLAVFSGHYEVMKVLLLHPDINVDVQVHACGN